MVALNAESQALVDKIKEMPPDQQQAVRAAFPPPPASGLTATWIVILSILGVAILLFGTFGFVQLRGNGSGTEVLFGIVTLALGGIIGVLAPSPVK